MARIEKMGVFRALIHKDFQNRAVPPEKCQHFRLKKKFFCAELNFLFFYFFKNKFKKTTHPPKMNTLNLTLEESTALNLMLSHADMLSFLDKKIEENNTLIQMTQTKVATSEKALAQKRKLRQMLELQLAMVKDHEEHMEAQYSFYQRELTQYKTTDESLQKDKEAFIAKKALIEPFMDIFPKEPEIPHELPVQESNDYEEEEEEEEELTPEEICHEILDNPEYHQQLIDEREASSSTDKPKNYHPLSSNLKEKGLKRVGNVIGNSNTLPKRTCNTCNTEKVITDYAISGKNKDGKNSYRNICKKCYNEKHNNKSPKK